MTWVPIERNRGVEDFSPADGADAPLLFDAQYAPKPAFYGVLDALLRR